MTTASRLLDVDRMLPDFIQTVIKFRYMSRKGFEVGQGMLDFVEDYRLGVKSH